MMRQFHSKNCIVNRVSAIAVVLCLIILSAASPMEAYAKRPTSKKSGKLLSLAAAKSIAAANDDKIDNLDIQIDSKQAAMNSAVRALREKQRNYGTVRWSPLFSIKFPVYPNEAESFEFQFKPKQLQMQMQNLHHKITSTKLDLYEKVSNNYVDIISAQEEMDYCEERADRLNKIVDKLKAKQALGEVTADKVDEAQKRADKMDENKLSARTKFERGTQKLSSQVGFDVSVGYRFVDAFITAKMKRDNLDYLKECALADDQTVYEAKSAEEEALLSLRINYGLIKNKYGGYCSTIDPYIQQAIEGSKINKKAFKKAYDKFLNDIDAKWKGSYKFLFIKIPKEWLKGDLDGIRYVQDDPQVLYTAALDYESAHAERISTENDLRQTVEDEFDNYVSVKNAYVKANNAYTEFSSKIQADEVRNLMGDISDDDYNTELSEFEDSHKEASDALKTYTQTLYSFDRTTCGGVSAFFSGASNQDPTANLNTVLQKGLSYTLRPIVSSEEFILHVNVPDDFESRNGFTVTDFELWADGTRIGNRTSVNRSLRHLTLATSNVNTCTIRLYNGQEYINECEIDPSIYSAPLTLSSPGEAEADRHVLGTYDTGDSLTTDTFQVSIDFDQEKVQSEYPSGEEVSFYNITTESGKFLFNDQMIPEDEKFTYLSFVKNDIERLMIHLYSAEGSEIGVAYFQESTKEVIHKVNAEEAKEIAEQKEKQEAEKAKSEAEKAAEEAAKKAAEEEARRREQAEEVLKKLGKQVNDENIQYAMNHLNELTYAADLKSENETLDKNIEDTERMIKEAQAAGEDTSALRDRLKILNNTKNENSNTFNEMSVVNGLK